MLLMLRTKLFLISYFVLAWLASLMQWGDERTSAGFQAAPPWFYRAQLVIQIVAIFALFMPLRIKNRPSPFIFFLSLLVVVSLYFANPIIEAEFVLIQGSILIAMIAMFLSFAQPNATFETSDIRLFFFLFAGGFALQMFLFLAFGISPSHSAENLFVRFNGITNDSLATGFILSIFIPWAVHSRHSLFKTLCLVVGAAATGSLFSAVFVPVATLGYLLYNRLYRFAAAVFISMIGALAYFYDFVSNIMDLKFESVLAHLRFFLNLAGTDYRQSTTSCSREFCESLIESGMYLSPVYLIAIYGLMLSFIWPLFLSATTNGTSTVVRDSLRVYGSALLIGSIVHPVPLIPFALPLFLILASLHLGAANEGNASHTRASALPRRVNQSSHSS